MFCFYTAKEAIWEMYGWKPGYHSRNGFLILSQKNEFGEYLMSVPLADKTLYTIIYPFSPLIISHFLL